MPLRSVVLAALVTALLALVLRDGLALALRTTLAARFLRQRDRAPVTARDLDRAAPKASRHVVRHDARRVIAVVTTH